MSRGFMFGLLAWFSVLPLSAWASDLPRFLAMLAPDRLVPGGTGYGPVRNDLPVAPVLKDGDTVGWAFLTSDFVGTTGYSGKPIHVVAAISPDAVLTGVRLVEHSEPIVLVGIPDAKMRRLTESYSGIDLKIEAVEGGTAHELDIISGATVTVMVIDDSVIRAGIKVARALGLGGLAPKAVSGPARKVDMARTDVLDWTVLAGDGSVRALSLDVSQVNAAFEATGDPKAIARPERGAPEETFIDLRAAPVSVPSIGLSLLGEAEYANLTAWIGEEGHAILVAGRGRYSFKGSGYVRGGIFDRIRIIQGDRSIRFFDRDHKRLGEIAAEGAPAFTELDIFRIAADAEFAPGEPWRLQLLVQRAVGAVDKRFLTFDLGYRLPERYLQPPARAPEAEAGEAEAKAALWQRVWHDRRFEIAGLAVMLALLSAIFFFQRQVTRNARVYFWLRMGFLTATLVFLGWYANAQLSVVNLMALFGSLRTGFAWDAFLLDPLVFILWFSVVAAPLI